MTNAKLSYLAPAMGRPKGFHSNDSHHNEPVFVSRLEPSLTELGIDYELESCPRTQNA